MLSSLLDALLRAFLRWLAVALQPFWPPPKPYPVSFRVTSQDPTTMALNVKPVLPPATASDVAVFELTYAVNGGAPVVVATSAGEEPAPIAFQPNDVVVATVVEIDGSGNRSEPSDPSTTTILDTIPPPKPGQVGFTVVSQD